MKTLDNPNKAELIQKTIDSIQQLSRMLETQSVNLMEVCGTHTMSVYRHGIKNVLPASIHCWRGRMSGLCDADEYCGCGNFAGAKTKRYINDVWRHD